MTPTIHEDPSCSNCLLTIPFQQQYPLTIDRPPLTPRLLNLPIGAGITEVHIDKFNRVLAVVERGLIPNVGPSWIIILSLSIYKGNNNKPD